MGGVYSRNKMFNNLYRIGADDLPRLEDDIHTEDSVKTTILEHYETVIEMYWPDFIRDFND